MADSSGRVRAASYGSRPLAELARGYLDEEGVDAVVACDDGNGTQPELAYATGGAWVMVPPYELDRARELLALVERPTPGSAVAVAQPRVRTTALVLAGAMALTGVWTTVLVLLR